MVKVEELDLLDVVWVIWPGDPKMHARPVVVVAIFDEVERPEPIAKVAYGSSQGVDRRPQPWEVVVKNPEDLEKAGLHKPTRFDLSSTVNVTVSVLKQSADRPHLRIPQIQRKIYHAALAAKARTSGE